MERLPENIQACLRDFQTVASSMTRKRHLASTARGFYGFCLAPSIRKLIRSILLIRGRTSQLIQDVANEAEGLFRYFKRSPKEYSA